MLKINKKSVLSVSVVITCLTFAGKLLSMAREMLLAQEIGMNMLTDAFGISQNAIALFTGVLGATCSALVPILIDIEAKSGSERRDQVFTSIFLCYMAICLVLATILALFSVEIMGFIAPGFNEETTALAADLLKIGFVKINLIIAGSLFGYYLQSKEIYISTALGTLFSSAIVVILLLVTPSPTIQDYTFYTVVGFVFQAVTPIPFLIKVKYKPSIKRLFETQAVKTLLLACAPLILSLMFFEVQTLVGKSVASTIGEGSVSALDYSNKIYSLLYGTIIVSLNLVLFTKIAQSSKSGSLADSLKILVFGGRIQLIIVVPLVILLLIFGQQVISLLYERGNFLHEDTIEVYFALIGYVIGCWGAVFADLLTKYYVSIKHYRFISIANIAGYGLSFSLIIPLSNWLGVVGITVA